MRVTRESITPDQLPPDAPNFQAVDNALLLGLRERGLSPTPHGERGWETGLPGLRLELGETMTAKVETKVGADQWFGHVEFLASIDHPTYGKLRIQDLVSLSGDSADAILAECIGVYLRLTFDPIRALFDEALFAAPDAQVLSVVDPGTATNWNVYTRWLEVRGADQSVLLARLEETPMLSLIGSTLAGYLAQPKLHWFKLYGESHGDTQQFGCIFDGLTERDGEREMPAVLNMPPNSGRWSYRGFALFVPHGEPDAAKAEALRAQLGPPPARKGPAWWPFGRPGRRVVWQTTAVAP